MVLMQERVGPRPTWPIKPTLAPPTALDTATERALYTHLQRHCRCFISIAHRKQLAAFHTHVLEATGDGGWVVHEAGAYLRGLGSGE